MAATHKNLPNLSHFLTEKAFCTSTLMLCFLNHSNKICNFLLSSFIPCSPNIFKLTVWTLSHGLTLSCMSIHMCALHAMICSMACFLTIYDNISPAQGLQYIHQFLTFLPHLSGCDVFSSPWPAHSLQFFRLLYPPRLSGHNVFSGPWPVHSLQFLGPLSPDGSRWLCVQLICDCPLSPGRHLRRSHVCFCVFHAVYSPVHSLLRSRSTGWFLSCLFHAIPQLVVAVAFLCFVYSLLEFCFAAGCSFMTLRVPCLSPISTWFASFFHSNLPWSCRVIRCCNRSAETPLSSCRKTDSLFTHLSFYRPCVLL